MGKKAKKSSSSKAKVVDLLTVDKPIAGQAYGCFSFVSPENIIKQREMYFFEQFVKQWDINKSMEKFHQFLNFIAFKYKLQFEDIMTEFETFLKDERETIIQTSIEGDYKTFLDREEEDLQKKFDIAHNFQTSIRGFKARGNFATEEEAKLRAKMLQESDGDHHVFVGPIGTWIPWDPEPNKTGQVVYPLEELNQLMEEKQKNEALAKNAFEQRIKETKQKAIDENKKNASKYGGVVTQDVDADGNLIGVGINSTEKTFATKESDVISVADLRSELFEGDNVVVGKTDYGQSLLVSGPFATPKDVVTAATDAVIVDDDDDVAVK